MKKNKISILIITVLVFSALALILSSCGLLKSSGRIKGEKPEGIADWDSLETNPAFDDREDDLIMPDRIYTARTDLTGQALVDYMNSPEYAEIIDVLNAADAFGGEYDPEVVEKNTGTGAFVFDENAAEITGVVVDPVIVEMNEKIKAEAGEEWEDPGDDPSSDTGSLPERYAMMIPDSVLAKAKLTQADSTYMLLGTATESEYHAIVNAFKNSGYTTIQELERAGVLVYSASGDDDVVTVSFAGGEFSLIISR